MPDERSKPEQLRVQEQERPSTLNLAGADPDDEAPMPESEEVVIEQVRSIPIESGVPMAGVSAATAAVPAREEVGQLFLQGEANEFRARWDAIQAAFVDEPRRSVELADDLVEKTMERLAEIFAMERETLEHQWDHGESVSTEDLRVALRRYRSFFGRLLAV